MITTHPSAQTGEAHTVQTLRADLPCRCLPTFHQRPELGERPESADRTRARAVVASKRPDSSAAAHEAGAPDL